MVSKIWSRPPQSIRHQALVPVRLFSEETKCLARQRSNEVSKNDIHEHEDPKSPLIDLDQPVTSQLAKSRYDGTIG